MKNTEEQNIKKQVPKLPVAFIIIVTIFAIVAPIVIVNIFKQDIIALHNKYKEKMPQPPKTYFASNFIVYGNAVNDNNWIGNIDRNSGFHFIANSKNQATAKLSIKYKSDNRSGILKVNGETQNLYFSSTNWNWGTKEVIIQLQQGDNNIEFSGGWLIDYAPDIAEIIISPDNNLTKDYIVGVWTGTYANGKGKATITINNDMTGISEFVWTDRWNKGKGSHSVRVNYSNGRYSISGVDWIDKPQSGWWSFDNWNGTIIDGKFSGEDFNFEKNGTIVLLSTSFSKNKPHNWRYSFIQPMSVSDGFWHSNSEHTDNTWKQGNAPFGNGDIGGSENLKIKYNTPWSMNHIFIRTNFNIDNLSAINNIYINICCDDNAKISLNGYSPISRGYSNGTYETFEIDKSYFINGKNLIAVKCSNLGGGQVIDVGVFASTKQTINYPTKTENSSYKNFAIVNTNGSFPDNLLRIRSTPNTDYNNSNFVISVPQGNTVEILEHKVKQDYINGESGYWIKVRYSGIGWDKWAKNYYNGTWEGYAWDKFLK